MIARPELVLVAVDEPMARAWETVAEGRNGVRVHRGSVTDLEVDAVVSPANSLGVMVGGIDGVYARWFPGIERRVKAATGGELPVGAAAIVPTGAESPGWLISAPTMPHPGQRLHPDGGAAAAAVAAVFRLWRDELLPDGRPVRLVVSSLALPGLGTGVGGLDPATCARHVAEAFDAILG